MSPQFNLQLPQADEVFNPNKHLIRTGLQPGVRQHKSLKLFERFLAPGEAVKTAQ